MATRIPFAFRDHYDPNAMAFMPDGFIEGLIEQYEHWLRAEYGPVADADAVFYAEGKRETYEEILTDLLGVEEEIVAYWGYLPTEKKEENTDVDTDD